MTSLAQLFMPQIFPQELIEGFMEEIFPMADVGNGPIEFQVAGDGNYVDLSSTMLWIQVAVTDATGKPYADGNKDKEAGLINIPLHSCFSDMIFKIGEVMVDGGDQTYPLKAYLDCTFGYSQTAMQHQLVCAGYHKDVAGHMDTATGNSGLTARKALTAKGTLAEFYGRPALAMFQQKRLLLNHTKWSLKLIKAKPEFTLFNTDAAEKSRFEIKAASLYVRKVLPNPLLTEGINKELAAGRLIVYPVNHVEIFYLYNKENVAKVMHDNLFYGRIPKMIVVGMLDHAALNGNYAKNPYNFQHFNLTTIDLKLNGISKPNLPLQCDFSKVNANTRPYMMTLYESLNIANKDGYLSFSYTDWNAGGYVFFVYNLTPDRSGQMHFPDQRANIRLDMTFNPAPTTPIAVVLYAIFDSNLYLGADGQVTTDFQM